MALHPAVTAKQSARDQLHPKVSTVAGPRTARAQPNLKAVHAAFDLDKASQP